MSTLEKLIEECIDLKEGNNEFGLYYHGDSWSANIGNDASGVSIGEASGDIDGHGETAIEAVSDLLRKVKTDRLKWYSCDACKADFSVYSARYCSVCGSPRISMGASFDRGSR